MTKRYLDLAERIGKILLSFWFLYKGISIAFGVEFSPQHVAALTYLMAAIVIITPWRSNKSE